MERQRHRRSLLTNQKRPRTISLQRDRNLTPDAIKKIKSIEEKGDPILTTIVTAYELLKGAHLSHRHEENIAKVTDSISNMQILDLSFGACNEAAKIYKELKTKSCIVGEFDILIAAITRTSNETLVTRDEHFKLLIPSSKLLKW